MLGRKKEQQTTTNNAGSSAKRGHVIKSKSSNHGRKKRKLESIPARRTPHRLMIIFSILTALCAVWMAVGQIVGIVIYENSIVTYVLRGYVVLLCLLVLLIEIEWPKSIRETKLFHYWVTRGLLYTFIGVVGMQENESTEVILKKDSDLFESLDELVIVVAWNMVGCGVAYFAMGIFCIQFLLQRYRNDYQERLEQAREENQGYDDDSDNGGPSTPIEVTHHQEEEAVEVATAVFADDKNSNWAEESTGKREKVEQENKEEVDLEHQSVENEDLDAANATSNEIQEEGDPSWVHEEEQDQDKSEDASTASFKREEGEFSQVVAPRKESKSSRSKSSSASVDGKATRTASNESIGEEDQEV